MSPALRITGRDHVVSKFLVDAPAGTVPEGWTARLLALRTPDEEADPYWPLYDYMVAHWTKSDTWQAEVARAVGLFWDYCQARAPSLPADWTVEKRHRELFRGFSAALLNGTIRKTADPLGLFWPIQPVDAVRRWIAAIEDFALWAAKETDSPNAIQPEKAMTMSRGDHMVAAVMTIRRRGFSLLGYLDPKASPKKSIVAFPDTGIGHGQQTNGAISFPPHQVETVLWEGFLRRGASGSTWDDYFVRDMMIFLLQAYAGAREHEPFHLWIVDVVENPERPGTASVFLYHPQFGLAYIDDPTTGKQVRTTRELKLRNDYNLPPRTLGSGSYRVGWKRSKVETHDYYAVLYWSDPVAAALFWELFKYYLPRREAIMRRRKALGYGSHPFLFVSEREARNIRDGTKFIGAPASIESYDTSLQRAVERVGLTYAKELGTTSHGLRHLYAYTLRHLGAPRKIIQEGLRHRNPFSQERYGIPTPTDINAWLERARTQSRADLPSAVRLDRTFDWIVERHPEYAGGLL